MKIEVGINPTGDQSPVLYDGHRHPFHSGVVDGTTPAATADPTSRTVSRRPRTKVTRPTGGCRPKTHRRVISKTTPRKARQPVQEPSESRDNRP
jgi:hypothetical protein